MSVHIFLGPTLARDVARRELDAVYHPPAGYGDIYRATLMHPPPRVIGLIDGYFRQQPAVRHKEVLWAMSQGIHVFGAASMGAIRAAELSDFGMNGVGEIFESLRDGTLEDDDEVTIDHGPVDLGYIPLNDAMVDMRKSFAAAFVGGVISETTKAALVHLAKQLFFTERTYDTVLAQAHDQNLAHDELGALRGWLLANRQSQKRDDALALLAVIREFLATDPKPKKVTYVFERTETWDMDVAFATPLDYSTKEKAGTPILTRADLLDELRLVPSEYQAVRQEAFARALVLREFRRQKIDIAESDIVTAKLRWSQSNGLISPQGIMEWCSINHVDEASFDLLIEEEAIRNRLETMADGLIEEHLVTALRARNTYEPIAARALAKMQGLTNDFDGNSGGEMSTFDLVSWFCEVRLGCPAPQNIDDFAMQLGFANGAEFHPVVLREFLFNNAQNTLSTDRKSVNLTGLT